MVEGWNNGSIGVALLHNIQAITLCAMRSALCDTFHHSTIPIFQTLVAVAEIGGYTKKVLDY
jgi:hypothetical protein